jgi:glutamate--cysteine ligase
LGTLLNSRIALLADNAHGILLDQGLRGVERETLRVTSAGKLAQTPHPAGLGSALTHPEITTDYAETLVEFITPAEHDIAIALGKLEATHRFAYTQMGDELLWSQSMPCELPSEEEIAIAWYGTSNIGTLKHVYRRGLAMRYGKAMQCIAGIHYNYSLPEALWQVIQKSEATSTLPPMEYQSESYIAMIRNFRRYSWLLMYLFGTSPALSANFLHGRTHHLETLSADTLYLPYATSLRMSDLGYQNDAQSGLTPKENSLAEYVTTLSAAVNQAYPPYAALGTKRDGEWLQLSANVLQIENEYYSTIRPKRVIQTGERPIQALCRRGVQYIEVRCLDVDPYEPVGLSLETARFLDAFLLFCALDSSPLSDAAISGENTENFARVVKEGRRPGLRLQRKGDETTLERWGLGIMECIRPLSDLLDAHQGTDAHAKSMALQRAKLMQPDLTPSARVLADIRDGGGSFAHFGLRQSQAHAAYFRAHPPRGQEIDHYTTLATKSVAEQREIERTGSGDFDQYIASYRASTLCNPCKD